MELRIGLVGAKINNYKATKNFIKSILQRINKKYAGTLYTNVIFIAKHETAFNFAYVNGLHPVLQDNINNCDLIIDIEKHELREL